MRRAGGAYNGIVSVDAGPYGEILGAGAVARGPGYTPVEGAGWLRGMIHRVGEGNRL